VETMQFHLETGVGRDVVAVARTTFELYGVMLINLLALIGFQGLT
jgi:hypothetical protein